MAEGYNMPDDVPADGDYGHPVWNQIAREFLKHGVTPTFGMVSQWGTNVNGGYFNQIASAIGQQYGEGGPQAPGAQPAAGGAPAAAGGGAGFGGIAGDWNNPTLDMIKAYGRTRGVEMTDQQAGYWIQQWPNLMRETPNDPSYALMRLEKADEWTAPQNRYGGPGGSGAPGMGDLIKPFTEQFTYADFVAPTEQDLQGDPGLAASIAKAKDTLERSAAARGSFLTGSTVQDIADRTASLTQDAYQNLYGRKLTEYNTNRGNAFDQYAQRRANFYQNQDSPFAKLFGMAQLESSDRNAWANQQLGWAQLGANTIAGGADRANQYGIGGANAAAAGQAGSGNAYSSLFGGLSQIPWYLASALRPGGSTRPAMPGTY